MSSVFDKLLKENELIKENEDIKQMTGKSHVIFKDNEGYPHWYLSISGPKKTPYEGGLFYIEIKFPKDYPNSPPKVQMRTPIYHPNINMLNGNICVDYVIHWNSCYDVCGLICSIFYLLAYPNPMDGYNQLDEEKAKNFRKKYAVENQIINSWDSGYNS